MVDLSLKRIVAVLAALGSVEMAACDKPAASAVELADGGRPAEKEPAAHASCGRAHCADDGH